MDRWNTSLPYGVVYVKEGRYAGRVGYYDDDDGKRGRLAIVYFSSLFSTPYVLIRRDRLRTATKAEEKKWVLLNMNEHTVQRKWKERRP